MDGAAFIQTYIPLRADIIRLCQTLVSVPEDAEDIAQDVLLRLWELRESLDEIESPRSYAFTLARNRCLDKLRSPAAKLKTQDLTDADAAYMAVNTTTPADVLREEEARERLSKWLKSLPEQQQKVFRLRQFELLSNQEVADRLGLQEVTVRSVISRLRKEARRVILALPADT